MGKECQIMAQFSANSTEIDAEMEISLPREENDLHIDKVKIV